MSHANLHVVARKLPLSGGFCGLKLEHVNLAGADFTGTNLSDCSFVDCNLSGAKFKGTELQPEHSSIPSKVASLLFLRCNLTGARFSGANCSARTFADSDLSNAVFDGSEMWSCSFRNCKFVHARLINSHIGYISEFTKCKLDYANLRNSTFNYDKFYNASLIHADFTGADLNDVKFFGCNFKGSNFTGVDLNNAKFLGCNLKGSNFSAAKNVISRVPHRTKKIVKFTR